MNSKKSEYVVFEGLPGAGKTTEIDSLLATGKACLVPDIGNPKHLCDDFAIDWVYVLEQESLKCSLVQRARTPFVLQERNYLSVLALHHAWEIRGIERNFSAVQRHVTTYIDDGRLLVPDRIVVLDISPTESRRRQPGVVMSAWRDIDMLTSIRDFYHEYARQPYFGENILWIDFGSDPAVIDLASTREHP